MKQMGFNTELENIRNKMCPFCKIEIDMTKFKDQLSLKEYVISGLCQKCQDNVFS